VLQGPFKRVPTEADYLRVDCASGDWPPTILRKWQWDASAKGAPGKADLAFRPANLKHGRNGARPSRKEWNIAFWLLISWVTTQHHGDSLPLLASFDFPAGKLEWPLGPAPPRFVSGCGPASHRRDLSDGSVIRGASVLLEI